MAYINWIIIGTAVLTIVLVALQDRSGGVGGAFGGGDVGGFYQRRRGVERFLFGLTVVCIAVFMGISLLNLTRFGRQAEPNVIVTPQEIPEVGDIQVETVPAGGGADNADVKIEKVEPTQQ